MYRPDTMGAPRLALILLPLLLLATPALGQAVPPAPPVEEALPEAEPPQPLAEPEAKETVSNSALTMSVSFPWTGIKIFAINPIEVTVENAGADFHGRIIVSTTAWVPVTQYVQDLDLPGASTKRLTFIGFEGPGPRYRVTLVDAHNATLLQQEIEPNVLESSDAFFLQVAGHPSDFNALRGDSLAARRSIVDLVPNPEMVRHDETLSLMQAGEPQVFPRVQFHSIALEAMPESQLAYQWVNTILLDLGALPRLSPSQRDLIERYVRLGGQLLLYPALDYGYPSNRLEDPLLVAPLEVGFAEADLRALTEFRTHFENFAPDPDRPLRFLKVDRSQARAGTITQLATPGGLPLLLTRAEGLGRVGLLLFQPVQLSNTSEAPRKTVQLLDRTGFTDPTYQQWFREQQNPSSTGGSWDAGSPQTYFFERHWAQRFTFGNSRTPTPYPRSLAIPPVWSVPVRFLRTEGVALLLYILIVFGLTQLILQMRRRHPSIWVLLPLAATLFILVSSPTLVQEAIPYRYAEWNILRFSGVDNQAMRYTGSWVENHSRHGTPITLASPEPQTIYDEFIYTPTPNWVTVDQRNLPITNVRQQVKPAFLAMEPHPQRWPRLVLNWGPTTAPGTLHGTLEIKDQSQKAVLTLRNDTPWPFLGGGVFLENPHLAVTYNQIGRLEPGESTKVFLEPEQDYVYRGSTPSIRQQLTPVFTLPTVSITPPDLGAIFVPAQLELLVRTHEWQQKYNYMANRDMGEFHYIPTTALVVGVLEGFEAPLTIQEKTPQGVRFTLAAVPVPVEFAPNLAPTQEDYSWRYF